MVKHMTRQVSLFTLLYHQNIRDSGNEQTKKHLRSGKRTNSKFSQTQNYKKNRQRTVPQEVPLLSC